MGQEQTGEEPQDDTGQQRQGQRWLGWRRVLVGCVLGVLLAGLGWHFAHLWVPGAVNVVRELPGVGFGRMHRFEQRVFGAVDAVRRAFGPEAASGVTPRPPERALAGLWPPAPLQPALDGAAADGEGLWSAASSRCRSDAAMVRTTLRVDPERPDIDVIMVSMDLRRLGVGFVPGRADGGPEAGRLPPERAPSIVATFNGGFQTPHGGFGMGVQGQEVVAALDAMATLVSDKEGRLWAGQWPPPEGVEPWWWRQNLPPLWDGQTIRDRPTIEVKGRRELIGHSITRRSGVCVRPPFELVYMWTLRGRALALGRAMEAAGCAWGMHLDTNAYHTSFEFVDLGQATRDGEGRWSGACTERLTPRMKDNPPGRYLKPHDRDFFYVYERSEVLDSPLWPVQR